MSYTRLYYHIVTATYRRYPLITPRVEPLLYAALRAKTESVNGRLIRIGGIADHVHLVVALPPTLSVTQFARAAKSGSCYRVRQAIGQDTFRWQSGYGAFTVSPRHMEPLLDYVARQKEHHTTNRLWKRCEAISEP
ncbi:MAG: IS200/IS605 family transposase [Longimonas sp.]|uniref:IS200/IS605 family transposase n=1 Tax=Longimonas sp. TaxID=2039626 RepID=UPI003975D847